MRRTAVGAAIAAVLVLIIALAWLGLTPGGPGDVAPASTATSGASTASAAPGRPAEGGDDVRALFDDHRSDVEVRGSGTVSRLLPDDDEGSRHQRFILEMADGLTVLVAHNIDIAPRLDGLRAGDEVEFLGEYAWSAQGGTVHWTHHDPAGRHQAGWLRWQGRVYG